MIADDWKILMKALAIKAQAIHFSKGTTQREQDAIADHMIGVAEFIENDPVPTFIKAISDSQEECLKRLKAANLQVDALRVERDTALGQASDEKKRADDAEGTWRETVIKAREARDKADLQVDELRWHFQTIAADSCTDHTTLGKRVYAQAHAALGRLADKQAGIVTEKPVGEKPRDRNRCYCGGGTEHCKMCGAEPCKCAEKRVEEPPKNEHH